MTTGTEGARQLPRISAVVCTRNRSEWSERAVRSLLAQDIEPGRLEVVIVDNASSDDTAERLGALVAGEPHAHYVFEPEPGLSRARNRALVESSGDIVAFLDDDAEAVPGWAAAYVRCFDGGESIAGAGGPIILGWPSERPEWLPARWDGMYAGLSGEAVEHEFEGSDIPYGANMAIRRSSLSGAQAFHLALGRQGEDLTSGEERELFDRLRAHGGRLVYMPGAEVTHHVLPDRLGKRWFLRRVYAQGRSQVLIDHYVLDRGNRTYWIGRTVYQAGRSIRYGLRAAVRIATRRPPTDPMDSLAASVMAAGISRESARVFVRTFT